MAEGEREGPEYLTSLSDVVVACRFWEGVVLFQLASRFLLVDERLQKLSTLLPTQSLEALPGHSGGIVPWCKLSIPKPLVIMFTPKADFIDVYE